MKTVTVEGRQILVLMGDRSLLLMTTGERRSVPDDAIIEMLAADAYPASSSWVAKGVSAS